MVFRLIAVCGNITGSGRSRNEDNFCFSGRRLPQENTGLKNTLHFEGDTGTPVFFAVFDGMGGEQCGEEAAFIAAELFSEEMEKQTTLAVSGKEFFLRACDAASARIAETAADKRVSCMGSTVAGLHFSGETVYACNVGDSKLFRIRGEEMAQLSRDHTDERILRSMGIKKKPVLLQFLGMPDTEFEIQPFVSKGSLEKDDVYIACSDGVTDAVEGSRIRELIREYGVSSGAVTHILAEADEKNGADNATVILIRVMEKAER